MTVRVGDRVTAAAPVRVCDVGGWTDTWFGAPGQVCSVAVGPGVEVTAKVVARGDVSGMGQPMAHPVRLVARDLGVDYWMGPSSDPHVGWSDPVPGLQPLLEHAVAQVMAQSAGGGGVGARPVDLAPDLAIEVHIASAVPPGASLGTSASVVVAVLAVLEGLLVDEALRHDPAGLARLAHAVETGRARRESGVQDQWAAALGGCLRLGIGPYPDVRCERLDVPAGTIAEMGERLVTVVFGAHDSSAVHGEVSHALLSCDGPEHHRARGALRRLAALAGDAADALVAGDVDRWAAVLVAATRAQATLHPALVGPSHAAAIDVARSCGATGWKVNGAGGDGGSLTVVAAPGGAAAVRDALVAADPAWTLVDLHPAPGLLVEHQAAPPT